MKPTDPKGRLLAASHRETSVKKSITIATLWVAFMVIIILLFETGRSVDPYFSFGAYTPNLGAWDSLRLWIFGPIEILITASLPAVIIVREIKNRAAKKKSTKIFVYQHIIEGIGGSEIKAALSGEHVAAFRLEYAGICSAEVDAEHKNILSVNTADRAYLIETSPSRARAIAREMNDRMKLLREIAKLYPDGPPCEKPPT
ncbi:MAG: hypothetical protein FWE08_00350 [Oscillospiraceae bacterium]|nr:hypothetical protein [Oscillospiraceae bacterium]